MGQYCYLGNRFNEYIMNINQKYVVNPAYKFRNDIHRVILTNNDSSAFDTQNESNVINGFTWRIHPYIAYIFSLFNGENSISDIFFILNNDIELSIEEFCSSIDKFINNEENIIITLPGMGTNAIPKNFLINNEQNGIIRKKLLPDIDINKMMLNLDMTSVRNYIPNEMTLMLNNVCSTNCIYCYADRKHHVEKSLTIERIYEILKEAKHLNMRDVQLDGGDFLIYPYWHEVLVKMSEYGFHPTISTKTPLTKEKVDKLIYANVKKIQLSLDSVVNDEIIKILNVDKHYLERVIQGIELLNNAHIQIILKPVITNINDSVDSMAQLISFASKYEMISDIYLTPADYSQFKPFTYQSSKSQLSILREKINHWKELSKKNVFLLGYGEPILQRQKEETFKKRSACSGNMNAFFVLPDGKVTLCEQLYWHPFFILGDLNKQSIMEMWNSPKAHSLWNISQKEIQEGSPCKKCGEFEECRRGLGNCWRLAVESYGNDYYDYPAPNCPKSPVVTKDMFIK